MQCDVYESAAKPGVLVLLPLGGATTAIPPSAGLGELKLVRIDVPISRQDLGATLDAVERHLEMDGYFVLPVGVKVLGC